MDTLHERDGLVQQLFKQYDEDLVGCLNEVQLQGIHSDMRLGGISLSQVKASMKYVCAGDGCDQEELFDVLQEMDRRYFLLQDIRWEFSMLDYNQTDTITVDNAKWIVQSVHGRFFSKSQWDRFLLGRAVSGSGVSLAEIEVMLCNIPSITDMLEEEEEERLLEAERTRKEHELHRRIMEEKDRIQKQRDEERKRRVEEDAHRKAEEEKRRREEKAERMQRQHEKAEEDRRQQQLREEEERGKYEAEERERKLQEEKENAEKQKRLEDTEELQELQRLKEMEARAAQEEEERRAWEAEEAMEDEEILRQAIIDEKDSSDKMEVARKEVGKAKDARSQKEHEDEEMRQQLHNKEARNKRIKYQLKVSYKKRNKAKLPGHIKEFKDAKLPDDDMDLEKAEKLLKEWLAVDGLRNAMDKRDLKELEGAMNFVRRNGFEQRLAKVMIEANKILLQLRRLERIRAEILELKQSTVAEIRSYAKPPAVVHTIMIATFLLHGHPEKQTRDWKTVQALVGKTGKDGLKRRCLGMEPRNLNPAVAGRAKDLLRGFSLDDVRDVSAGAATFYLWGSTMIEECEAKQASDAKAKEGKEAAAATVM